MWGDAMVNRGDLRRHKGFSLIELLVVLGIIAVFLGMLLPAVQRVREAAERTGCQNNLRQLGLGLHHYHDCLKTLPSGYLWKVTSPDDPLETAPGWGWAALILPYLEHGSLAERIDWQKPVGDSTAAQIRTAVLPAFVCPADRATGVFTVYDANEMTLGDAATNSYAASYGAGGEIGDDPGNGNGLFYRNSRIRLDQILDGASNTIAVGERASLFTRTPWAGALSQGTTRITDGAPVVSTSVEEAPTQTLAHTGSHVLNDPQADPDDFFSPHPGMGMFLFGDGSVRSIRFRVDRGILQALSTRNGGETIDPDRY